MFDRFQPELHRELQSIKDAGLYKQERVITSPQGAEIEVEQPPLSPFVKGESSSHPPDPLQRGKPDVVLNFCANNYLGLSSHPKVIKAAKQALEAYGFGMSSVRFICGTQSIHKTLEKRISEFLQTDDTILYAACFDANGGLFECLFNETDAIISDELNHASIIDGVRLCKAKRYRYKNSDMADLKKQLEQAAEEGCRQKIICTDGVFSMDGYIAKLDKICELAEEHKALVMVDEAHATGFIGKTGRGTIEYNNVMGKVDIITGTLGKALGGAMGGFTSGRKEIIEMLRQRSRPYLFSNSLAPAIAGASIAVFEMLSATTELRDKLESNTKYFREEMKKRGFDMKEGVHPIVPIMLYDAKLSQEFASRLLEEGIYVIGFYYPVVPKGQARIRVQISAAHELVHIDKCINAFEKVGKELGILK